MSRPIYTEQVHAVLQAALALIEGRIARVDAKINEIHGSMATSSEITRLRTGMQLSIGNPLAPE